MSLEERLLVWEFESKLLDKDFDKITFWWIKNKPCFCIRDMDDPFCYHYDKIIYLTLGKKMDELHARRMQISVESMDMVFKN